MALLAAALSLAISSHAEAAGKERTGKLPVARRLANDRSIFFGTDGDRATLRRVGRGKKYRLTLHDVPRRSRYLDSHPLRTHARIDTGKALRTLFAGGRRVGAIEVPGAPRRHDSLAAMLSRPRYDEQAGTVTFAAEPLAQAPGDGVTPHGLQVDASLPTELGEANLYVGGPHDGQYCKGVAVTDDEIPQGDWFLDFTSTKWSTDSWAAEPAWWYEENGNEAWLGWQSDGEDGRGCSNSVTVDWTPELQPGETAPSATITMKMTYLIGNKATVSCGQSEPAGYGTCSYSTHKGGAFDTDLTATFTIGE
ncbi:MAG: hypothetical protein QM729_19785 [Solirubrobacterales bacterium]